MAKRNSQYPSEIWQLSNLHNHPAYLTALKAMKEGKSDNRIFYGINRVLTDYRQQPERWSAGVPYADFLDMQETGEVAVLVVQELERMNVVKLDPNGGNPRVVQCEAIVAETEERTKSKLYNYYLPVALGEAIKKSAHAHCVSASKFIGMLAEAYGVTISES